MSQAYQDYCNANYGPEDILRDEEINMFFTKRNELRKAFLDGQISESGFINRAKEAGMPLCDIEGWIDYVKTQDGIVHVREPRTAAGSRDSH